MHRKLILFTTLIIFTLFTLNKAYSTNLLFLTYDYGDANAFKAIIPDLKKNGFDYEIIALGKSKDLFKENSLNKASCLQDFNNNFLINDRNNSINRSNIDCIKNTLLNKPDIIVSGMSSATLADILNSYSSQIKIAYYDNFDPYPENSEIYYTDSFMKHLKTLSLNSVFITSKAIKASFIKNFNKDRIKEYSSNDFIVVGNPSIVDWKTNTKNCPQNEKIETELNIPKNKKIIVFAGDTTSDYKIAFENFTKAIKEMPNYEVIVAPHPKTNGEIEKNIQELYKIKNMIITNSSDISTICLTNLSKVFIVHKSSIGMQALSGDKNVIYIANDSYENIAIQKNVAKRVFNPDEINNAIKNSYNEKISDGYSKLGISKNPVKNFIDALNQYK